MELLITAAVLALLIYGLERNKSHRPHTLTGSTHIHDRDTERLTLDLRTHP
ncbi:hypothetical protein [Actinophytocola sediminis]